MEDIIVSIFFIIYGILGLFGIQVISQKYKNTKVEKEYKKNVGVHWIITGVLWLFINLIEPYMHFVESNRLNFIILAVLPGVIYLRMKEKKFKEDSLEEN